MAELIQKKLQGEVEKYQQLQKDLSKSMSGRQKLEAQLTENNIVKEVRAQDLWGEEGTCPGNDSDHRCPAPPSGTGPAGWIQRGL